ncbi:hypothetical protein H8E77_19525 [bacterium]|nr:hypothetical protein [bacterium]
MSAISYDKLQEAYRKVTGRGLNFNNITESLQVALKEKKTLDTKKFAKLPLEEAAAYLEAHRLPKKEVIKMLEKELADFENQYDMPSDVFMEKWRKFELDEEYEFFIWESSYKKYLQLNRKNSEVKNYACESYAAISQGKKTI